MFSRNINLHHEGKKRLWKKTVGFYTAENLHDIGKSSCSIGNTCSFMPDFPASHLSFRLLSFSGRLDGISMISILPYVQSFGIIFLPMENGPPKKKTCQLHHWQYSSRLPPELSQLSLFVIGLALMLQPHQVSLPHTSRSGCEDWQRNKLPVVLSDFFFLFLIQSFWCGIFEWDV